MVKEGWSAAACSVIGNYRWSVLGQKKGWKQPLIWTTGRGDFELEHILKQL